MKLYKSVQIEEFLSIINKCKGDVYLTSMEGDKFNLKSKLSQYIAIGALLDHHHSELELWCTEQVDEALFYEFFDNHPEVL